MRFKPLVITLFYIIFAGTAVFSNVYNYPVRLEVVMNQLPKLGSIKCGFKQEKYIKNLTKPLVSSGEFEFKSGTKNNSGVFFHTTYPLKSDTSYTNKNYKQINDIINAISSRKYSRIEKEFDFFYTTESGSWVLGLKPKKSSDAYPYISEITLWGKDYITRINIVQTNGNKTVLWFKK